MSDDLSLEQRVHALIYDADPEIPAAAVIAAVRAAVADEIRVMNEVRDERAAQDAKWGEQNHPNGTGPWNYETHAIQARTACDAAHKAGRGAWADILLEEVYEALAESDPISLRQELVQAAAVAVAWIEAIDRAARIADPSRAKEKK